MERELAMFWFWIDQERLQLVEREGEKAYLYAKPGHNYEHKMAMVKRLGSI